VYFVIHSILADHRTKAWFSQKLGEYFYQGFYRILYNAIALITLLPIVPAIFSYNEVIFSIDAPFSWIMSAFQLVGIIGLLVSFLQIDWMQFAGITQMLAYLRKKTLPLPTESLQVSGLYGLVRHPLYFFSLLVVWLNPTLTVGMLLLNVMVTLYVIIGSRVEEQRMIRIYGESYRMYMQKVPWLLPSLRKIREYARSS
jgi:protein-S-isoprenylcysteine O-methyltransferase Ste14